MTFQFEIEDRFFKDLWHIEGPRAIVSYNIYDGKVELDRVSIPLICLAHLIHTDALFMEIYQAVQKHAEPYLAEIKEYSDPNEDEDYTERTSREDAYIAHREDPGLFERDPL